jgi:hypothetical protein
MRGWVLGEGTEKQEGEKHKKGRLARKGEGQEGEKEGGERERERCEKRKRWSTSHSSS